MKILYLLHTDWNWIKQRSQFLAENLSNTTDITVAYKFSFKRGSLVKNRSNIKLIPCFFLPFSLRVISLLSFIDRKFWSLFFNKQIKSNKYDLVIVTHPLLYDYVKSSGLPVIYDCHDDNAEFYKDGKLKELIQKKNTKILEDSKLNIFSSNMLKTKYEKGDQNILVRNGHNLDLSKRITRSKREKNNYQKNIIYFGTISEWFDNSLIEKIVKNFEHIKINIIGPCDTKKVSHHRVIYHDAMNHNDLMQYASKADAFIMPFVVNELIEGVDPVKLYEYIFFDVPVISVFYEELLHFQDHIHFYNNHEEALNLFNIIFSENYEPNNRDVFLQSSSWHSRSSQILDAIKCIN